MDTKNQDKAGHVKLADAFKSAATIETQNKEVAAMMGNMADSDGRTLPGGIISTYGHTESKAFYSKKKKRERALLDAILREALRRALDGIQFIIEFCQEQMERLLKQIREEKERLEKLDREFRELGNEIHKFQEQGRFELDEKGALKNREAEQALLEWEHRTGLKINRTDYREMLKALAGIEAQKRELEKGIEKHRAEYEHYKVNRDEALKMKEALESNDPERRRAALEEAEILISSFPESPVVGTPLENPDQTPKKEVTEDEEWTIEQMEQDDFSFGFPPLQDEFSNAVAGEKKKIGLAPTGKTALLKDRPDGMKAGR